MGTTAEQSREPGMARGQRDALTDSFSLAVAVIRERISELPKDDQDDVLELLPVLMSQDDEERVSALQTVGEILGRASSSVRQMDLPGHPDPDLSSWLGFVSARIRDARSQAGMNQEDLAKAAGIPQGHISRLENGQHSPTAKTLEKIAAALGISVSVFDPAI